MKIALAVMIVIAAFAVDTFAQTAPSPRATPARLPSAVPVKPGTATRTVGIDKGSLSGRTYTNRTLGFEVEFPDSWLMPDDDFERTMKAQGYDLSLKAPDGLPAGAKARVNSALRRVTVLLTAYRSMPVMQDNAIARISVEDLAPNPQIKDAVDYIDAVRSSFLSLQLPKGFTYSETLAEKLGTHQFAYMDTNSLEGKKRMYVTVIGRKAVLFTLSYTRAEDLAVFRRVLEEANFNITK